MGYSFFHYYQNLKQEALQIVESSNESLLKLSSEVAVEEVAHCASLIENAHQEELVEAAEPLFLLYAKERKMKSRTLCN